MTNRLHWKPRPPESHKFAHMLEREPEVMAALNRAGIKFVTADVEGQHLPAFQFPGGKILVIGCDDALNGPGAIRVFSVAKPTHNQPPPLS